LNGRGTPGIEDYLYRSVKPDYRISIILTHLGHQFAVSGCAATIAIVGLGKPRPAEPAERLESNGTAES
jgi:hypothetical protein